MNVEYYFAVSDSLVTKLSCSFKLPLVNKESSLGHYNTYWPSELFSQSGFHSDNDLSLRSKPIMLKQGNGITK